MKKIIAILFILTIFLSLTACDFSKIEISVEEGIIHIEHSDKLPKVNLLVFEGQIPVENPIFFEKLVSCIEGKNREEMFCSASCENIYVVEIGKYDFALHKDHILIYTPLGHNIKGVSITQVECTEEEINELVALLDEAKFNN